MNSRDRLEARLGELADAARLLQKQVQFGCDVRGSADADRLRRAIKRAALAMLTHENEDECDAEASADEEAA